MGIENVISIAISILGSSIEKIMSFIEYKDKEHFDDLIYRLREDLYR